MARTTIDRDSVEYLTVPVKAPSGVTLGTQTASIALVEDGKRPGADDWSAATWQGSNLRVLVGPLPTGRFLVFVRIGEDAETPLLRAGSIYVA